MRLSADKKEAHQKWHDLMALARVTTAGVVQMYTCPTAGGNPDKVCLGPDGAIWFAEHAAAKVGRIVVT